MTDKEISAELAYLQGSYEWYHKLKAKTNKTELDVQTILDVEETHKLTLLKARQIHSHYSKFNNEKSKK